MNNSDAGHGHLGKTARRHAGGGADASRRLLHRPAALRTRARSALQKNVVLRGTRRRDRTPGSVRPPRTSGREHRRHAGLHRTGPRVPQRLPSPRHAAVHGIDRSIPRQHSVPLPLLDLRSRRKADWRPTHGRGPSLQERGLPAARRARRRVGRAHLPEPVAVAVSRFAINWRGCRRSSRPGECRI